MTLEITHSTSPYTYRINADDPRLIDRRPNRHNARWKLWRLFDTSEEAKAALLKLETAKERTL